MLVESCVGGLFDWCAWSVQAARWLFCLGILKCQYLQVFFVLPPGKDASVAFLWGWLLDSGAEQVKELGFLVGNTDFHLIPYFLLLIPTSVFRCTRFPQIRSLSHSFLQTSSALQGCVRESCVTLLNGSEDRALGV